MIGFLHIPKTGGTSINRLLEKHGRTIHIGDFANVPDLSGADYVTGHMPAGLCARNFTFLRHPVDRVISDWHYIQRSRHPLRDRCASLADYLDCRDTFMNDNGMVRRLARYDWAETSHPPFWWQRIPHGQVTREHLEQAKQTLDACFFVGLFDRFADDVARLAIYLGWQTVEAPHLNASTYSEEPQAIRDRIAERHALDLELYDYASRAEYVETGCSPE